MTAPAPTHLVFGYEPGDDSEHALSVAADLATRLDAHLHVVHVVELLDYPVDPDAADWEQAAQTTLQHERARIHELFIGWPGEWTYHTERGEPVHALTTIADAHDALMIVVGTRGHGLGASLQRLLNGGSVGHGLVRGHHRPVLIVPPGH